MGSLLSNRNVVVAAVVLSVLAHVGVSFPYMGDAFDAVPALGPIVTGMNEGLATVTAAAAVMIVMMNIKNRVMGG